MCDPNPNGFAAAPGCRADFVLVNHEKDANCHERATALAEKHGPPFAQVLRTGDPSPEWLATNHLGPLSDDQRAAFDRDGIVLLRQHPFERNYEISITLIAEKAVEFGCERLASVKRDAIPISDLAKLEAWQESHDTGQSARGSYAVECLDNMTVAQRVAFFRKAYREMASPHSKEMIDRYEIVALDEALEEKWSARRDRIQQGRFADYRQAE